jgi:hypothetical protein
MSASPHDAKVQEDHNDASPTDVVSESNGAKPVESLKNVVQMHADERDAEDRQNPSSDMSEQSQAAAYEKKNHPDSHYKEADGDHLPKSTYPK